MEENCLKKITWEDLLFSSPEKTRDNEQLPASQDLVELMIQSLTYQKERLASFNIQINHLKTNYHKL